MRILAFADEMLAAHEPAFVVAAGDFTNAGQFAEPLFDELAGGGTTVYAVAGNYEHGQYAGIIERYATAKRIVTAAGYVSTVDRPGRPGGRPPRREPREAHRSDPARPGRTLPLDQAVPRIAFGAKK